jgi:hypothetical protein
VRLISRAIDQLKALTPTDRHLALRDCAPIVSQFAMSIIGARHHKVSAWIALNLAIRIRLKPGEIKAVALALTSRAKDEFLAQGRFKDGRRVGFEDSGSPF